MIYSTAPEQISSSNWFEKQRDLLTARAQVSDRRRREAVPGKRHAAPKSDGDGDDHRRALRPARPGPLSQSRTPRDLPTALQRSCRSHRQVGGLGPPVPDPCLRETTANDLETLGSAPRRHRARTLQRTRRIDEHQVQTHHPHRVRLHITPRAHRTSHAQPWRPQNGAPRPERVASAGPRRTCHKPPRNSWRNSLSEITLAYFTLTNSAAPSCVTRERSCGAHRGGDAGLYA